MKLYKNMANDSGIVTETLSPYEYEWSCLSCGFNFTKKNMNSQKFNGK